MEKVIVDNDFRNRLVFLWGGDAAWTTPQAQRAMAPLKRRELWISSDTIHSCADPKVCAFSDLSVCLGP